MGDVVAFPHGPSSGGGGNAGGGYLDVRVARLEDDVREIKLTLKGIEARLSSIEVSLARLEGRIAGIEARLQHIPTVWQTISILAVLLFGVAGVVFAAGNFLKP